MRWFLQLGLSLVLSLSAFDTDDGRRRFDGAAYPKPHPDEAGAFFASGYTPYLKITLDKKAYESLLKTPYSYAHCTVTEGDTVYTDVAIHLKGHASFRPINEKPGLTLNFNKFQSKQKFHGMGKLHLNNSVQDGTYLHELAGSLVFGALGAPVGQVTQARVDINGRALGVCILVEGFDRSFLQRHFANAYGSFYDGARLDDIHNSLPQRSKNVEADKAALKTLVAAAQEPDPVKRRQRLDAILDVNEFMSLMVAESIISHWDGYCAQRNNYSFYRDPTTDKFAFFPHDMDQIFGDPNFTLMPANGMLARAMIDSPADKRRYLEFYQKLFRTAFHEDQLTNTIMQAAERVRLIEEASHDGAAGNALNAGKDLCRRILERARGIERALGVELGLPWEPKPLKGWQNRSAEGNPTFDEFKEGDQPRLRIRAGNNQPTVGSWRVRVTLPQGKYLFEGRVRTVDVPQSNDPNQGAALRVSGGQRRASITGSTDWRKLEYEISADQGVTDIELVCELRATRGEAWFDTGSLRLNRK